ncbi:MAG: GGDEF domain-containing protein [Hyphomicrobiales bacterium]|nr:MAG: GGDEF domain-containing protein [Hyphomicrobiales bacterium]
MRTVDHVEKNGVEGDCIDTVLRKANVNIKAHNIIEDAAFGMFLIGTDRRVVHVNTAFCDLLGYSFEECIGLDVCEFIHPDERKEVTKKQTHLAEGRTQNYTVERKYLHKDGSTIPVLSTVTVYVNSNGKPQLIAAQLVDISALKATQKQLFTSEQRSTFALEAGRQGVWDSNLVTGEVYHSDAWREMRGYPLDENDSTDDENSLEKWITRIHPDDRDRAKKIAADRAEGNFDEHGFEFRELHYKGYWIWILSRGHAIEWGLDGKPTRIIGTDTDISHLKEAELNLEDASSRLELALSTSKIGVWNVDLTNGRVQWDNLLRELFEQPDLNILDVPRDMWEKSLHPDDADEAIATIQHVKENKSFVELSYRIILPSGSIKHIHSTVRYFVDAYGRKKILGTKRDVTDEVTASSKLETALEQAEINSAKLQAAQVDMELMARRLEMAVSTSGVGVWELDLKADVITWDDTTKKLYGQMDVEGNVAPEGVWFTSLHPEDAEKAMHQASSAIKTRGRKSSTYRIIRPDGTMRHIHEICRSYVDDEGEEKFIGVCRDITDEVDSAENLRQAKILAEQKSAQLEIAMEIAEKNSAELENARAAMEFNSLHDALTGLPNRRYLDEKLAQASNVDHTGSASLLHIDLDRFKQINDTLGHAAGDTMLIHTAKVLREIVGEENFTARVGGDEFVVLMSEEKTDDELAQLAKQIVKRMRKPIVYDGHECRTGVSVGISRKLGRDVDPKKMLVNADIALYRAKEKGRNRYEFFTDELEAEITNTKRLADEILTGLEKDQFFAYYQPQFDANSLEIVGVEALARWNHPTRGILAPDQFLKIAEDLNVVSKIDRLIMEQSLAHLDEWHAAGISIPKVSVNVSARRLQDDALIASLKELNFRPGTLSFELLESIFLDDSDEAVSWNIDQIKELGIEIDIDDFGSGHAPIIGLLKLNPHRLKIDQQLIRPIDKSKKQLNLVKSIVDIGKSLGVQIVAEGVETMEHVRLLRTLGCDILQGYVFAKPMCVEDLMIFTKNQGWREVA